MATFPEELLEDELDELELVLPELEDELEDDELEELEDDPLLLTVCSFLLFEFE
ncbi:MAG: hypothetical protein OHK0017_03010 [Patescibacteria group bacterium]